jgi:Domain of unknown function (DUF4331)
VDGEGRTGGAHGGGRLDPGQVPANGPNFFGWDDRARCYIHIDNTGDGRPDVSYRYQFKTTVKNKKSFLYALPGAAGYNDPKLNVVQRYSIVREIHRYKGKRTRSIGRPLPVGGAEGSPTSAPRRSRTTGRSPTGP